MTARTPNRCTLVVAVAAAGAVAAGLALGACSAPSPSSAPEAPRPATSTLVVDDAVSSGLRPLASAVAPLVAGQQSWVRIPWTTDAPVCSVAVTVSAAGAAVTYPENTKDYASFYRQSSLAASARDYTAVLITVPGSTTSERVTADVTATYTTRTGSSTTQCTGSSATRTFRVTVPVTTAG